MGMWKRLLGGLLALAMTVSILPVPGLALEHHPEHDELCGYQEAFSGTPCAHVCDDSCAAAVTVCRHDHASEGCVYIGDADPGYWACGHVCSPESGCVSYVCGHVCPDGCGYEAPRAASPCAHVCESCAVKTVESWSWVDPDGYLTDGELVLPGVSEVHPIDLETVLTMLPAAVSTEHGELSVSFSCPDFPESATSGSFSFTAALPEGYQLSSEAAPLTVSVVLGGADTRAENEFTSGSWKCAIYVGANKVSLTQYIGSATTVTVPTTVNGYTVGDIGAYCFSDTKVKSVTIPSGIGTISSGAFRNAEYLQTVTILGAPTVGSGAFYNCSSLTTVSLGSITSIPTDMFGGCDSLLSITIPNTVTSIGSFAFSGSGLSSVTIGSGVTTISKYAFSSTALTTVTLPAKATLEDGTVFYHCADLASINVSSSSRIYKSVDGVLYTYNGRTLVAYPRAKAGDTYVIVPGTSAVGDYAFSGYSSSTTLITGGTMKYLKKVIFPPSITTLGKWAFDTTTQLTYCFCGDVPSYSTSPLGSGKVWYTEGRIGWSDTFAYRTATPWPAEDHATNELETYPATCGSPATVKRECPYCGFTATVEDPSVPATGDHKWGISYSQYYHYLQPKCSVCGLNGRVDLSAPTDCTYTGQPIEAVVTGAIPPEAGEYTLTYTGEGLVDGKPVLPGTYRATLAWGTTYTYSIYVEYTITRANEETPEASIDYKDETVTGLIPGGSYTVNGLPCTADESGSIPLEEDWLGSDLVIVKKAEDDGSEDSEPQTLATASRPEAPSGITAVPETLEGEQDGKLLGVTSAMEYRAEGGEWISIGSDAVEGLAPGSYEVRYAATDSAFASAAVTLTVDKGQLRPEQTPDISVDFETEYLVGFVPGESYDINGTDFLADQEGKIPFEEAWLGSDITVVKAGIPGVSQDSAPQVIAAVYRLNEPEGLTYASESVEGAEDGKIMNVSSAMEYRYENGPWQSISGETLEGLAPGIYELRNKATDTAFASDPYPIIIDPGKPIAYVTYTDIPRQLFTGAPVEPVPQLTFTGTGEVFRLTEGVDYTLNYEDNVEVGTATVTVQPLEGGKCVFEPVTIGFQIALGVAISDVEPNSTVYVDGLPQTLDGDILWLEEPRNAMITAYSYHNAGAEDIHTVYPTGMTVWELRGTEARRLESMDDALLYGGTSIRTVGNQGIRFITSVPKSLKNALKGSGLEGYTLVEYGTLMGWYAPGTQLLYGVNAKSVAYDRASGTDAVFADTGSAIQFTGMLTDLDLEQSTKDLMTRPYMVLEKDGEQLVLYGGSLVRSIGYVALQNKDVFRPGTADYEFIWNIISYAYPEIYEAEYGK